MDPSALNAYQRNAILTASPAELTLMLYEGVIKFGNMAIMAIEKDDFEKKNTYLKKAQAIIVELRSTLDHKYPVWEDFDRVYEFIYNQLVDANINNDKEAAECALQYTREMRDTWKEVMRLNRQGG